MGLNYPSNPPSQSWDPYGPNYNPDARNPGAGHQYAPPGSGNNAPRALPRWSPAMTLGRPGWFQPPPPANLPVPYKPPGLPVPFKPNPLPQINLPGLLPRSGSGLANLLRRANPAIRIADLALAMYQAQQQGPIPAPAGGSMCCGTTGSVACSAGGGCSPPCNPACVATICTTVGFDCQGLPCPTTQRQHTTVATSGINYFDPDPLCPFTPRYIFRGVWRSSTFASRYIPGANDAVNLPASWAPQPWYPLPSWWPGVDPLTVPPLQPAPAPQPTPHNEVPNVTSNPDRAPGEQSQRGPRGRRRTRLSSRVQPAPVGRPQTRTRPFIWLRPGDEAGIRPPGRRTRTRTRVAERLPPGPRVKERKVTPLNKFTGRLLRLVGVATEGADLVSCLYKGLPEKIRKRAAAQSGGRSPAFRKKLALLYQHFDKLDFAKAAEACAMNQLEDAVWANLNRYVRQLPGQQYLGRFGASSRTSRPGKLAFDGVDISLTR